MLQQTLAIFLVLGLLFAALWLLRRQGLATYDVGADLKTQNEAKIESTFRLWLSEGLGRTKSTRRLRLIERVVLTPHHSLHLISVEGRPVLFATSPTGCEPVNSALIGLDNGSKIEVSRLHTGAAC